METEQVACPSCQQEKASLNALGGEKMDKLFTQKRETKTKEAAARFRLENERKQEGTRDGSQRVLGRQNTCIWTGYNNTCLYHLDDAHRAIKTAYFKSQIGFENTF